MKFKRCCDLGFTRGDEQSAIRLLGRACTERPPAENDRLWDLYYGPLGRVYGPGRDDDAFFTDWLYFDARDSRGERLVDIVLRSHRLSQGERVFLNMVRGTAPRLYEFAPPVARRARLREILTGEECFVSQGSLDPPTDDTCLLLARVIPRGASGWPEVIGARFEFPGVLRAELVSRLKYAVDSFRETHPGASMIEAYKASALILRDRWSPIAHAPPPALPGPDEALREAAELRLQNQYDGWLDQPMDQLDGGTPRAAVKSAALRPRVVELLHELDRAYERALKLDEPAFDPSWLWDDLGLREQREGASAGSMPHGHDTTATFYPGLAELTSALARKYRHEPGHDLERSIRTDRIIQEPEVREFVYARVQEMTRQGVALEQSTAETDQLHFYVSLLVNFDLHLRKVCRVSEELSWCLGTTSLDGEFGADLRLPFGTVAFKFTDRYALGLAERLLARSHVPLAGKRLRVLTAQVTQYPLAGDRRVLRVAFLADALNGERPVLFGRELRLDAEASLINILALEVPGKDAAELSPIFACLPMRHLLHLVMNAIIHMTSCRPPPEGERKEPRSGLRFEPTGGIHSEEVLHMPGTIDISVARSIQQARRGAISREQIHRCMVRGYRRRANPGWKDQTKRWIKPHWRGPAEASIVEREYRLIP